MSDENEVQDDTVKTGPKDDLEGPTVRPPDVVGDDLYGESQPGPGDQSADEAGELQTEAELVPQATLDSEAADSDQSVDEVRGYDPNPAEVPAGDADPEAEAAADDKADEK